MKPHTLGFYYGSADNRDRLRPHRTMRQHNQGTWRLAGLMLAEHGIHALYGARAVSKDLRQLHPGEDATYRDVIRAMDFLLSDEDRSMRH